MKDPAHNLIIWLTLLSGIVLSLILYNLVRFNSESKRYTRCDAAQHEFLYHGVVLPDKCKE